MKRRFLAWAVAWALVVAPATTVLAAPSAPSTQAHDDERKDQERNEGANKDDDKSDEAPSEESPRASLEAFLNLCRDGRYEEAGAYLDLSRMKDAKPATMARRLKAVLDRYVWFDLDDVSGKPDGNTDDGLPADVEEIAKIPSSTLATKTPVRLVRDREASRWVFAKATVSKIDGWYDQLEDRWLLERLPQALLRPGPRDILWWQWIALPLLLFVSGIFGALTTRLVRSLLLRVTEKTENTWDDTIVAGIRGPLMVAMTMLFTLVFLPFLQLYPPAQAFLHQLVRGALLADFFWVLARLIDAGAAIGRKRYLAGSHATSRALIPLATRVGKVVVLAIAIVAFLSELGYPVASLIAGLGLGGLAFALAAQKTVENLFGAFSIGADQTFVEGDTVRVDDLVGTVEVIGLRSTKIRTADRTLVTMPNGALAEKRVETFAARDRIRLGCNLALVYETTSEQMKKVIADVQALLESHPKVYQGSVTVLFTELSESSLKVEVQCWFATSNFDEFQRIRQDVLLDFLRIVEAAGTRFAFPTRIVQLAQPAAGQSPS